MSFASARNILPVRIYALRVIPVVCTAIELPARKAIRRLSAAIAAGIVLATATSTARGQSSSFTNVSADTTINEEISILPVSVTFASQVEGTTSGPQSVTITNPGNSAVNLLIALSGAEDYVPYDTCIGSIAAGASCTISLTFGPTNIGSSPATLTITNLNDGYSQSVALTGTGIQQSSSSAIALSSSQASLQMTAAGPPATSNVYITPQNGFQGAVNLQCKVVAVSQGVSTVSPVCSLSTSQVTISSGNDSSSELSVSTQTASAAVGSKAFRSTTMSLAGLVVLGLLPLGRGRKRIYACLSLLLAFGVIACGSAPSATTATSQVVSNDYTVIVTASSGGQSTSISIPLEVK